MLRRFIPLMIGISLISTSCADLKKTSNSKLNRIKERGYLKCGISGKIPGFSFRATSNEIYQGLDVDICKAIAAGILGDKTKLQFRELTAAERFTALQTGEVDILSRNTTFNLSRDSARGNNVTFAPVIFYDEQGIMVKKSKNITQLNQLSGASICVGSGTTSEQNINDIFQEKQITYKPIKYQDLNQVTAGYLQDRCDVMTSDKSQLWAIRSNFKNPSQHLILNQIISKEPLAPATSARDSDLSDATRWIIYSLFAAEEYGITKANVRNEVEKAKRNQNLFKMRRFLGIEGGLGNKIGIPNDFVLKVISATGNYGEIYRKNLGPESNVNIPRGLNNSFKKGGLLISPPFN